MELKLDKMQYLVLEHGQHMLESNSELEEQQFTDLEKKCAVISSSNGKLIAKTVDLESRSHRNNIRLIGLPEFTEGPRLMDFFAKLLVNVFGNQILQSRQ
ncbi:hypothetical protein XENORESO_019535 [Xenotaenia resolanae]|uniref:Uncharacterized protein n=1 Tax=Xenotaenia resolanae TaxID=208358 RepID=A0ABV0WZ24_9TELE